MVECPLMKDIRDLKARVQTLEKIFVPDKGDKS